MRKCGCSFISCSIWNYERLSTCTGGSVPVLIVHIQRIIMLIVSHAISFELSLDFQIRLKMKRRKYVLFIGKGVKSRGTNDIENKGASREGSRVYVRVNGIKRLWPTFCHPFLRRCMHLLLGISYEIPSEIWTSSMHDRREQTERVAHCLWPTYYAAERIQAGNRPRNITERKAGERGTEG